MATILDVIKSGRRFRIVGEKDWRSEYIKEPNGIRAITIYEDWINAEFEIEPEPPSQDELDKSAFKRYMLGHGKVDVLIEGNMLIAWHAALIWERERVK